MPAAGGRQGHQQGDDCVAGAISSLPLLRWELEQLGHAVLMGPMWVYGGLQVYGQVSAAVQERQRLVRQLLQAVARCLAVRTLPTLPPRDVRSVLLSESGRSGC